YRKIALFAQTKLTAHGRILLEINEALGEETKKLFETLGYKTELRRDLHGKNRMLKAFRE
ncbi:MAG: peptide chain release factor N(5)-glutamine methyltransferase, partial [Bacteroidota bacterium]